MRAKIVCLSGDGIGPEVMQEAVRVLTSVACAFGHSLAFVEEKLGRSAISAYGAPVGPKTLEACRGADAVLLGAGMAPTFGDTLMSMRPEHGLSLLQNALGLYAGIQYCPTQLIPADLLPLGKQPGHMLHAALVWPLPTDDTSGSVECEANAPSPAAAAAEQAARLAFQIARRQRNSVCCVCPAEQDAAARLFMDAVSRVSKEYTDVHFGYLTAEACAASLVRNPQNFDVLLVSPKHSRPFSGLMAGLCGGLSLCPSTFTGDGKPALYLPAHGEEHALAGRDMANPIAMILSAAMMLRNTLHLNSEADCVEMAVKNVLDSGWRTQDLADASAPKVGTQAIGKLIVEQVDTAGAVMGAFHG